MNTQGQGGEYPEPSKREIQKMYIKTVLIYLNNIHDKTNSIIVTQVQIQGLCGEMNLPYHVVKSLKLVFILRNAFLSTYESAHMKIQHNPETRLPA